jgi:hypothetical protein
MIKKISLTVLALVFVFSTVGVSLALEKPSVRLTRPRPSGHLFLNQTRLSRLGARTSGNSCRKMKYPTSTPICMTMLLIRPPRQSASSAKF